MLIMENNKDIKSKTKGEITEKLVTNFLRKFESLQKYDEKYLLYDDVIWVLEEFFTMNEFLEFVNDFEDILKEDFLKILKITLSLNNIINERLETILKELFEKLK